MSAINILRLQNGQFVENWGEQDNLGLLQQLGAEQLGLGAAELRATYDQALLRYIGCNAETRMLAAVFGDELALRTDLIHQDPSDPKFLGILVRFIREANTGASPLRMAQAIVGGLTQTGRQLNAFFAGHCEVAGRLAERLGLDAVTISAIRQVYARWDGKGVPPLKGEAIAPGMLVVSLAQDAAYIYRLDGVDAAVALVQKRKGTLYAPKHVEVFVRHARTLFAGLDAEPSWAAVLACEPGERLVLTETQFDTACQALADFADIKSPYMLGHSPAVAALASAAARIGGLGEDEALALWRAGLLHDLGRVGVSAGIWTKPSALTEREWEQVRLHPYYTERILARSSAFAAIGALAALHCERLDGSGYHRRLPASLLSPAARLLIAADVFQALLEPRPRRPARTPDAAATELARVAQAGGLDPDAVRCVLAAAGQPVKPARPAHPAQLTDRELDVLRLIARGHSIKQMA